MLKPSAPAMPGVTDTLEFVKNLWGSMQIPGTGLPGMPGMPGMAGIAAPPMSTEDLDKRIADLKAVESWLNLNLSMLRGTIQALEVQRGTLMTLKTMGASMAEAMRQSGVSAEKMASMPFSPFFGAQGQGGAARPAAPAAQAPKADAPKAPNAAAAGGGTAQSGTATPLPGAADAQANPAAMAMPAAVAWWNMLQEQFTQAVANAMTPSAAAPATPGSEGGGGAPKADAPREAPKAPPAPPTAAGSAGSTNGKPRTTRARTDKT
jgi:hypothetical protein